MIVDNVVTIDEDNRYSQLLIGRGCLDRADVLQPLFHPVPSQQTRSSQRLQS